MRPWPRPAVPVVILRCSKKTTGCYLLKNELYKQNYTEKKIFLSTLSHSIFTLSLDVVHVVLFHSFQVLRAALESANPQAGLNCIKRADQFLHGLDHVCS